MVPGLIALGVNPATQYDTLLDIVFSALTRGHPALARDEFDDWPIATYELLDALPVIAQQTGLMRKKNVIPEMRVSALSGTQQPDWDTIIARFVNFLPGTTWDYWEDALTIARLDAMNEEWRLHPPPAMLAAAWLGYKPRPRGAGAVEELMRLFPGGKLRLN